MRYVVAFLFVGLLVASGFAAEQAVEFGGGNGNATFFSWDNSTHVLKVGSVVTVTPTATPTSTPTPTATATP
jgi:hypothetical protein